MNWKNELTKLLKIEYPFIQAPMLLVTTPEMVAAVSNVGGLGTLPLGYVSPDKALERIQRVKQLSNKPFAVNLFVYDQSKIFNGPYNAKLKMVYKHFGIDYYDKIPSKDPYPSYLDILPLLEKQNISAVSFHFGIPDPDTISWLHNHNIITMASATCVKESVLIEKAGIDIVIAQGIEAGGNRGSFIEDHFPQVGLVSLVPQIVDAVTIPVVAAGGIMQGRSAAAAFILGAMGVQMGSLFLRCYESQAPSNYKNAIKEMNDTSTVLTKVWSGRYGRCLENFVTNQIAEEEVYPAPFQQLLTQKLRMVGKEKNDPDMIALWAGQSARYAPYASATEIINSIIQETANLLK